MNKGGIGRAAQRKRPCFATSSAPLLDAVHIIHVLNRENSSYDSTVLNISR